MRCGVARDYHLGAIQKQVRSKEVGGVPKKAHEKVFVDKIA